MSDDEINKAVQPESREVITTVCPLCLNETLVVAIESSGHGQDEYGTNYWFSGSAKCGHCSVKINDYSDSSH